MFNLKEGDDVLNALRREQSFAKTAKRIGEGVTAAEKQAAKNLKDGTAASQAPGLFRRGLLRTPFLNVVAKPLTSGEEQLVQLANQNVANTQLADLFTRQFDPASLRAVADNPNILRQLRTFKRAPRDSNNDAVKTFAWLSGIGRKNPSGNVGASSLPAGSSANLSGIKDATALKLFLDTARARGLPLRHDPYT